jgi:hypothetical protein
VLVVIDEQLPRDCPGRQRQLNTQQSTFASTGVGPMAGARRGGQGRLLLPHCGRTIASGWSECRVGLAPTGKRRLVNNSRRTLDCEYAHVSGHFFELPALPAALRHFQNKSYTPRALSFGRAKPYDATLLGVLYGRFHGLC